MFDATSSLGLTNAQTAQITNGTYANVTRRLRDYYVASNFKLNNTVDNITQLGVITLFKLDYQTNSIYGSVDQPGLGEYILIGYDSAPDTNIQHIVVAASY